MARSNFNEWAAQRDANAGNKDSNGQSNPLDAPLGDLDTNQYKYASFIYPLDLGAPGSGKDHYMVFHINETSMSQFITRSANGNFYNRTTNPNGDPNITDQPTIVTNANKNKAAGIGQAIDSTPPQNGNEPDGKNGNAAQNPTYSAIKQPIRRVSTTIVLPMPNDIKTNYEAHWEAEDLGFAADIVSRAAKGDKGASWKDIFTSGGISALKVAGVDLNNITGLNLSAALSRQSRLTINNHQEVIFNGIGFRPFTFSFRFTPESEAEALNVDNIIRAFKFYAAPELLTGTAGRFWIYPAEFDIQYYANGQENEFLNKISTCALVDMQVNYTPTGHWAAHRPHSVVQGAPSVCTDITLTFKELEIMSKHRILEGY